MAPRSTRASLKAEEPVSVPLKSDETKLEEDIKKAAKKTQSNVDKKLKDLRTSLASGPFPSYSFPTAEECQTVAQLLATTHGYGSIPRSKGTTPAAYDEKSFGGCGNVANVMDALIRTVLSCNTSGRNSKAAHVELVKRFGKYGWEEMMSVPKAELAATIKCGGLHERKAGIIQGILQRTKELHGKLSLDHLHGAPAQQVMEELISFNGVGPKVGSCVAAFCIGLDEMAVDTHVFRLAKALSWVPEKATRDQTYYHLAERVPSDLKYGLHVLLIRHGKSCSNCSAKGIASQADQYLRAPTPTSSSGEEEDADTKPYMVKNEAGEMEQRLPPTPSKFAAKDENGIQRECPLKAAGLLGSKGKARAKKEEVDAEDEKGDVKAKTKGAKKAEAGVKRKAEVAESSRAKRARTRA